ncbi:proteasome assembly chaperone 3-like [Echinops telfairi]|uniref:Proteasome assembly chaperone 3-like n=1 Tax=Echinops telfairi TaxID=9371 RepID=A0AC55D5Q2_ECHTE|nr:proteasome assembly chaperone 3-like [Echinops telfairi]
MEGLTDRSYRITISIESQSGDSLGENEGFLQGNKKAPSTLDGQPLVVSKQQSEMLRGVPTQVVYTAFSSHMLVVVTQFGKMGTLVPLEPSEVASDISKPMLTTRVLLGQDEPLVHVFAKNLVTFVSQEAGNQAVLLALAVKDQSMEGMKALREVIQMCQVW